MNNNVQLMASTELTQQEREAQFYNNKQQMQQAWPPWPFNLLTRPKPVMMPMNGSPNEAQVVQNENYENLPGIHRLSKFIKVKARGSLVQMQQMGSALSFHLPPAAPPLLLLALLPAKQNPSSIIAPQIHSIAQKAALASLSIAVLSWADYEVRKQKRLTPLPLSAQYRDVRKAILPPFLPEELPSLELDPVLGSADDVLDDDSESTTNEEIETKHGDSDSHNYVQNLLDSHVDIDSLKKSIHKFYEKAPNPRRVNGVFQSWKKMNHLRKRQDMELKRKKIMEELVLLKEIKMRHNKSEKKHRLQRAKDMMKKEYWQGSSNSTVSHMPDLYQISRDLPLGYALVTGASRGIGRSIAIELARWEIPLILVARDVEKLKTLADDIQTAYGVNCCVIQGDLSNPETAKQIYETTETAGLRVDILVNNAGVCPTGDVINADEDYLTDTMNLNVASVTKLSHLYGKSMKRQRRGRILFVSSVAGAVPGVPGVACYSATKAYEKVLAHSMGRELEKYGVGVTCLLPGAVKGTEFASRSNLEKALAFRIPFYAMKAPDVASRAVRAMLSGDAEVIPGWHNRLFLKVLSPILPQRLTASIAEISFAPLKLGLPSLPWKIHRSNDQDDVLEILLDAKKFMNKNPPMVLNLQKIKENVVKIEEPLKEQNVNEELADIDDAMESEGDEDDTSKHKDSKDEEKLNEKEGLARKVS
ncbi:hypothetical protein CTEN210_11307 [Chaetoceros tenuissimus]|nr:hypothetical protein CTEN210_11307 [Chaetoceros tenuissimus]